MADTTGIGDYIGTKIPSVSASGIGTFLIYLIGGLLLAGLVAFGVYWFIQSLKYNKRLVLFRKIGGKTIPCGEDKGMFARVGQAGDFWCKTKKFKKTLPRPRIETGPNTFWFFERSDGEWINFGLSDLDEQMKKAGAYYVDEDMRLQRLGIQKNLLERFKKVTFWDKYGGMIMNVIFLLIVTICLVILFKSMKDNWNVGREMAQAVRDMAIEVANVRTRTGSGIVPALIMPLLT